MRDTFRFTNTSLTAESSLSLSVGQLPVSTVELRTVTVYILRGWADGWADGTGVTAGAGSGQSCGQSALSGESECCRESRVHTALVGSNTAIAFNELRVRYRDIEALS